MVKITKNKKIAIVASKFNGFITKRLLKACLQQLEHSGVSQRNTTTIWVPGSFDIPVVALKLAKKNSIDAVICLGAVIRGETFHFELVAQSAAYGIVQAALFSGKPVIFGVLSTETTDQAYQRSKENGDNKGRDAAIAALDMIDCLSQIK